MTNENQRRALYVINNSDQVKEEALKNKDIENELNRNLDVWDIIQIATC